MSKVSVGKSHRIAAPKVSILIPIYNVESYLRQCLESVCAQTLNSLEIICINDGSIDGSLDIIKEFKRRDSRIILLNKSNTGYGDSMNRGLDKATGEYIGIVEPDDFIRPDMFQILYSKAEEFTADVVKAGFYKVNESVDSSQQKPIQDQPECDSIIAQHKHLVNTVINAKDCPWLFKLQPAIWSALYRREFLIDQKIKFLPTPGASYQDLSFAFKVWAASRHTVLLDEPLYYYRINAGSSVNSADKVNCVVDEYNEIETYLCERGIFGDFGRSMAAARFRNYHWNFQRLRGQACRDFYQIWREALLSDQKDGLLVREDFRPIDWRAAESIIKHPRFAYIVLGLRKLIRSAKI